MEVLIALFSLLLLAAIIIGGANLVTMTADPGMHLWPSVARCRLCNKRIWVWQRYERRPCQVSCECRRFPPELVAVSCDGSSLVHRCCPGQPVANVSIKRARGNQ